MAAHQRHYVDQGLIPGVVAIAVVDLLEVVHIHGDHRKRLMEAARPLALQLQRPLQPIATGGAGQSIGLCQQTVLLGFLLQRLVESHQLGGTLGNLLLQRLIAPLQLFQ